MDLEFILTHEPVVGEPVLPTLSKIGVKVSTIIEQLEAAENA